MGLPWHDFHPGEKYALGEVIAACERRIADGVVIQVKRKQKLVDLLREHAPPWVLWSPFSTGWGASAFNPNCWRTADGKPILPEGIEVPKLSDEDS